MCPAIILLSALLLQSPDEADFLLTNIADARIRTSDNSSAQLSSWYSRKPIIMTLVYSRCPGVCNPYLLQIRDHVLLQAAPVERFQMLVLSFDTEDSPAQLRKLAGFNDSSPPPPNWTFGVLEKENSADLLSSIGFQTQPVNGTYDHNTVMVLVGQDGRIHQWIEGLPDNRQWDRLFRELTNDFVPVYSTLNRNVWTSCFQYDPASGYWKVNWGLLMILAPSALTVCIIMILQAIATSGRRKRNLLILIPNNHEYIE
ncbi:MAG: SCO family protein [Bacteroidetes bacterium]|nr:SCO family protein [Bacteroidota bacterium]